MYIKKLFKITTAIILAVLVSSNVRSQDLDQKLNNDSSVVKKVLPNGLTYYIKKNQEPKNRAVLYMVEKVGSTSENDQQQGLAHFLEHMAFNGTKSFPKNQLIDYLQKAGVKFGADLNAYTSFNETVYQLPVPTDTAAVFQKSFQILADWAGGMLLENNEIDNERGVIIEEDRQRGKNAQQRMQQKLFPILFYNSRYKERIPIGKVEVLKNFKYETLKDFYKTWYRPNLQAVIAVGDFDVKEVEQLIIKNFSSLSNPAKQPTLKNYDFVPNEKPLVEIITDPEQSYNIGMIFFKKFDNKRSETVGDLKKEWLTGFVNNVLGNRIKELTETGKADFAFAQSNYGSYQGGIDPKVSALQNIVIAKSANTLTDAIQSLLKEVFRLTQFGITQSELDVSKKSFLEGLEKSFKEKDKTNSNKFVQQYVDHFLHQEIYLSDEESFKLNTEIVKNISLAEVNAFAKTIPTSGNETILIQASEKDKEQLPSKEKLLETVNNASRNLTAYEDKSIDKPLLDSLPDAGNVTGETKDEKTQITRLELSNGVEVYLKPTTFKNDEILFSAFQKGGASQFDNFNDTQFIDAIIGGGVSEFSQADLRKLLAGKSASVNPYLNELYQGFFGSSSPKDLETALQQVYAYYTKPRKDQAVFDKNIQDYHIVLKNKYANPENVFADSVSIFMANHNPRFMPTTIDDLKLANIDQSLKVYQKAFSNANQMQFVIVGNINPDTIRPLLEKYIASLPSNKNQYPQYTDRKYNAPTGKHVVKVYKGLENKSLVLISLQNNFEYNRHNAILLSAIKEGLTNKLLERLREKESGVYSPQAEVEITAEPTSKYNFLINFSCASENVDRLIKATFEEIDAIKNNGIAKDDFTKFQNETARSYETNINKNSYWLASMESKLKNGQSLNEITDFKNAVQEITFEEVKKAAKQYLETPNVYQFILLPEAAKK